MTHSDMDRIIHENEKLKNENKELKQHIKKLEFQLRMTQDNPISENTHKIKNRSMKTINIKDFDKDQNLSFHQEIKDELNDEEQESMSIVSFLARSDKRVQILKSISETAKIPSAISKEIGDSSHHVSKYLTSLKEKELVVCLNEEDKRFRFYRITAKGKYYLEIIENNQF
ncbi:winged helix-turn-helix domain-containing protein [uncultured Methanobrevibacter sp.]|uniref:winged helix-turn-helix domain-containing protein n=1 Tax=uncultured Methanobrevibacter sp. TaxID=253161 RepID=UPI0026331435|nr:winged helix-turn-helix domain-containing protein [uncultured Methanobrevibacter sp.]